MCETKTEFPQPPREAILDMAGLKEGLIYLYIRDFLKDNFLPCKREGKSKCESVTLLIVEVELFLGHNSS